MVQQKFGEIMSTGFDQPTLTSQPVTTLSVKSKSIKGKKETGGSELEKGGAGEDGKENEAVPSQASSQLGVKRKVIAMGENEATKDGPTKKQKGEAGQNAEHEKQNPIKT